YRVRARWRAEPEGRVSQPAQPGDGRGASRLGRGGDRRRATPRGRRTLAGGVAQGRPRGVPAARAGVVGVAQRHGSAARAADARPRVGPLAPLVARRHEARLRERPRRPCVYRRVRRGDEGPALSRPERRLGRGAGVVASPDGATIVYSSNQDDIERRHIWKVAVAGGAAVALTRGTDLEWTPVVTGDGRGGIAFIRAGTRTPPHPMVLLGSEPPRDLAPGAIPAAFPEAALVDPQPVLFPAADGTTIHAQLFLPRGLKPGERRPAVVFFHGGSRGQMLLGWHYFYYYRNAYAPNQYLASRGY